MGDSCSTNRKQDAERLLEKTKLSGEIMPNTPSLLSVSPYSRAIAREMYPGQMGQDDQQDAARHMLAAGTMARKYGPTVADLAGKVHEYSTSPLRALMMLLGRGQMPPDYEQDMHNNALGIELARRAQSQRELEDLIQSAAERAATTRTEGRPWVNKAKGGQVRGYQAGGQVSGANFPTGDFDPARIDTIVGELHALNAG